MFIKIKFDEIGAKCEFTLVFNYVIKHNAVRACGGIAPAFLTSALDESEWSASRPGCVI
jgi:hypothetical protein